MTKILFYSSLFILVFGNLLTSKWKTKYLWKSQPEFFLWTFRGFSKRKKKLKSSQNQIHFLRIKSCIKVVSCLVQWDLTSVMKFGIKVKCRIKFLKDFFPICCRAAFFRPEKINFKINEINRNTSIYFSLYNLQFTLIVSYQFHKFWNQHDWGRFPLFKRSAAIKNNSGKQEVLKYRKNWKGFFLKTWYKFVKNKIAYVIRCL